MRRSVDLPAPFAPSSATASPGRTSKEIPARATTDGFSKGCRKARQPLRAGGKDFWRLSTLIAASGTTQLIACLWVEDNRLARKGTGPSRKPSTLHGEVGDSAV